jgi:hypothetical protein
MQAILSCGLNSKRPLGARYSVGRLECVNRGICGPVVSVVIVALIVIIAICACDAIITIIFALIITVDAHEQQWDTKRMPRKQYDNFGYQSDEVKQYADHGYLRD